MKQQEVKAAADEIVEDYKKFVYPYLGSGMLTNTHNDTVIEMNATRCALIAVRMVLDDRRKDFSNPDLNPDEHEQISMVLNHWQAIETELKSRI